MMARDETFFTQEFAFTQNRNGRGFSFAGKKSESDAALADIKKCGRRTALGEDDLLLQIRLNLRARPGLVQEKLRMKPYSFSIPSVRVEPGFHSENKPNSEWILPY